MEPHTVDQSTQSIRFGLGHLVLVESNTASFWTSMLATFIYGKPWQRDPQV